MAEPRRIKGAPMSAKSNQHDAININTPAWFEEARCAGLGFDAMEEERDAAFPTTKAQARLFIRNYCNGCQVKVECNAFADRFNIEHGIWGGVLRRKCYEALEGETVEEAS